jgi:hypothetical protein
VVDPVNLGHRRCDGGLRGGLLLTGWAVYAGGLWCLLLGVLLVNRQQLTPSVSPTVENSREPSTGQADDLTFAVIWGPHGIVFVRRLDRRSATTPRRATESGAGQADHWTVGVLRVWRVVIRCFHGRTD